MSMHALLALDQFYPGQKDLLEGHFDIIRPKAPDPERTILKHANDIKAIYTALAPVTATLIESLPNLEIISVAAVGYDHIDLVACKDRGITVTNTPDIVTADTADTAMLLMLTIMRRGVEGDAFVRAGLWQNGPMPLGSSLTKKKVGIVGLGRIGKAFARRAQAFDMDISYFGPNEKPQSGYTYYDDLEAMANDTDVLVLTCVGGTRTKGLVNYSILEALGSKGFIVNVARGSVLNERDLLMALSNKTIGGAALDVYENEPHVPSALFNRDDVVLLPHLGTATIETRTKMGQIVAGNLLAHFNGEPLITPLKL